MNLRERAMKAAEEERERNTYDYEETPIKCEDCNARCFGLVKSLGHKRRIVHFVCPVCEHELHYALLSLTGQIEH